MTNRSKLLALAEAVERATHCVNKLDVQVEIALFRPDETNASIRANDAGTKVIYSGHDGREGTFWSQDWTLGEASRRKTAAALRERAAAECERIESEYRLKWKVDYDMHDQGISDGAGLAAEAIRALPTTD